MNYIDQAMEKFRALPSTVKVMMGSFEVLETIENLEEKHNVKLGFLIILVAIGDIQMQDIEYYLQKRFDISQEIASEINKVLQEEIFTPILDQIMTESGILAPDLDLDAKKKVLIELFKENLVETLSETNEFIDGLNFAIFDILRQDLEDEDVEFDQDLLAAMLSNQEKITSQPIMADGKKIQPTISNWLQDFTHEHGSEIFTSVILSDYLMKSENSKKLTQNERAILSKILVIYRNLKFFPESLEDLPAENRRIVPIDLSQKSSDGEEMVITKKPLKEITGWDLATLTPIEIKALAEEHNMTKEELMAKIRK